MDRLAMLEKMVREGATDPFVRYALAMEYRRAGRIDEAIAGFAALVEAAPDYVPTYLMYGQTLLAAGRAEEARAIFEKGIVAARAAGDEHAESELSEALAES